MNRVHKPCWGNITRREQAFRSKLKLLTCNNIKIGAKIYDSEDNLETEIMKIEGSKFYYMTYNPVAKYCCSNLVANKRFFLIE